MFDRLAIPVTLTSASAQSDEEENKLETEWWVRFEIEECAKFAQSKTKEA